MLLDPISGAVQVFDAWMTRRQIDKWIKKLIFNYALSWFITTTGTIGTTLTACTKAGVPVGAAYAIAVGTGLLAGASVLATVWYRDPDLKGAQLTLRQDLGVTTPSPDNVTVKRGD